MHLIAFVSNFHVRQWAMIFNPVHSGYIISPSYCWYLHTDHPRTDLGLLGSSKYRGCKIHQLIGGFTSENAGFIIPKNRLSTIPWWCRMSQPSTVCSFLDVQRLGVRSTPPSPHPRSKHHQFLSCSAIEGAASGERVEKAKNSRASQGHIVASHRCFLESFSYSKDGKPIGCLHGANNYGIGLSCHCMYFLFHSKMDPKMQLMFFLCQHHGSHLSETTHNQSRARVALRLALPHSFLGSKHGGLKTCLGIPAEVPKNQPRLLETHVPQR